MTVVREGLSRGDQGVISLINSGHVGDSNMSSSDSRRGKLGSTRLDTRYQGSSMTAINCACAAADVASTAWLQSDSLHVDRKYMGVKEVNSLEI